MRTNNNSTINSTNSDNSFDSLTNSININNNSLQNPSHDLNNWLTELIDNILDLEFIEDMDNSSLTIIIGWYARY